MVKTYHIIFLPAIFIIGIFTSLEDIRESKIRNRWIIFGLLYCIAVYLACWAIHFFSLPFTFLKTYADNLLVGFDKWLINMLISISLAYLLWHFRLWGAGDAKLFICYSSLIPVTHYSQSYGNYYYASLGLLRAIFIPALCFFIALSCLNRYTNLSVSSIKGYSLKVIKKMMEFISGKETYKILFSFFIIMAYYRVIGYHLSHIFSLPGFSILPTLIFLSCFRWLLNYLLRHFVVVLAAFFLLIGFLFLTSASSPVFIIKETHQLLLATVIFMAIYLGMKVLMRYYNSKEPDQVYPFAPWMFLGILIIWFF